MHRKLIYFFVAVFISTQVYAETYFVAASGGGTTWANCTNISTPCTLATANSNADDNDIVYLRGGNYSTGINPSNSGSNGNVITFQNYTGETPTITNVGIALLINGKSYVKIIGISFGPIYERPFLLNNGASYNEIAYCTFSGAGSVDTGKIWDGETTGGTPCVHNWFHHNTFADFGYIASCDDKGGMQLGVPSYDGNSNYHTFENNTFYGGGHHNLETFTKFNVIRNNYFHHEGFMEDPGGCPYSPSPRNNKYGNRNIQIYDGYDSDGVFNLIEGNRSGYAAMSPDTEQEGNYTITSPKNIVRYNYSFYSETFGLAFKAGASSYGINNRVYNNTLYYNGQDSFSYGAGLDWRGGVGCHPATNNTNILKNNLIYDSYGGQDIRGSGSNYSCSGLITDTNNYKTSDGDPLFTNIDISDPTDSVNPVLALQSTSDAINNGTYLTTVHADDTGSGTTLKVADALYFQDGTWGSSLAGHTADWIAVGTVSNVVQISAINYSTNTITLVNGITRSDSDPVWLYKKSDGEQVLHGSAPDYGAYEYVSGVTTIPQGVHIGGGIRIE